VLFEPDIVRQSEAAAERLLLSRRRLGGMMQGIESGPVGIGNRPRSVPDVPLVSQHIVALLRHPHVGGRAAVHGEEAPGIYRGLRAGAPRVVRADRIRLPLPADDVCKHVVGDIVGATTPRVSRVPADRGVPVHNVYHPPHLRSELLLPPWIIIIAAWR